MLQRSPQALTAPVRLLLSRNPRLRTGGIVSFLAHVLIFLALAITLPDWRGGGGKAPAAAVGMGFYGGGKGPPKAPVPPPGARPPPARHPPPAPRAAGPAPQ